MLETRSLGAPTWLGEAVASAWHAPERPWRPPRQGRRGSFRARAPEQYSGTLSSESDVSLLTRGLVKLCLRHGTLVGALCNTLARSQLAAVCPFCTRRVHCNSSQRRSMRRCAEWLLEETGGAAGARTGTQVEATAASGVSVHPSPARCTVHIGSVCAWRCGRAQVLDSPENGADNGRPICGTSRVIRFGGRSRRRKRSEGRQSRSPLFLSHKETLTPSRHRSGGAAPGSACTKARRSTRVAAQHEPKKRVLILSSVRFL